MSIVKWVILLGSLLSGIAFILAAASAIEPVFAILATISSFVCLVGWVTVHILEEHYGIGQKQP